MLFSPLKVFCSFRSALKLHSCTWAPRSRRGSLRGWQPRTSLKPDEAASARLWVYTARSASCCRPRLTATSSLVKFPGLGSPPSAAVHSNGPLSCAACAARAAPRSARPKLGGSSRKGLGGVNAFNSSALCQRQGAPSGSRLLRSRLPERSGAE